MRGFDVIDLGCLDQRVYGGRAFAPFMGARAGLVTPDRDTAPRRASIEGVQSKLQRVVRLTLEHVRGNAREGRWFAIFVLPLGEWHCG
jgi:hypothetical protein